MDPTVRTVVVAVGAQSQWGRIKAKLQKEESNTPLQDKLDTLAEQIGYVGMGFAANGQHGHMRRCMHGMDVGPGTSIGVGR